MSKLNFSVPGKEDLAERLGAFAVTLPVHYQRRYAVVCGQARETTDGVVMSEVFEAVYGAVSGVTSLIIMVKLIPDLTKCDSFVYRKNRIAKLVEDLR